MKFPLSFGKSERDTMIYEFLIYLKGTDDVSKYIKKLIENDLLFIEWRGNNGK